MPPTSDGKENIRTVGCALDKLVPDASHLEKIRHAVAVTHKATILASELLNIHLRRLLAENLDADLREFFSQNWILNAYNEVCPRDGVDTSPAASWRSCRWRDTTATITITA